MTHELKPQSVIICQSGLQSVEKPWSQLAWEYIGAKSPDLKRIHAELTETGASHWEGFGLLLKGAKQCI